MIYSEPILEDIDHRVLAQIGAQRDRLRVATQNNPQRWTGALRRSTFARAIQGSNTIEGYNATIDQAIAAIENETASDERSETLLAIKGYRNALSYIIQAVQDPYLEFGAQFLKSMHFMMIGHELHKLPGQWRPGAVYVRDDLTGEPVYEGPPAGDVNELVGELVAYLNSPTDSPTLVRAAMAHLNLVMIHPFKDGNGRMARALQTFVLSADGIMHPVFSSIEEWLGRHSRQYYDVLGSTGQGRWQPGKDAFPWVRFCLTGHHQHAATLIRRHDETARMAELVENLIKRRGLHERMVVPLVDMSFGMAMTNTRYQTDADVTQYMASRDLKRLSDLGLVEPVGEKRGRRYLPGPELAEAVSRVRSERKSIDPYA